MLKLRLDSAAFMGKAFAVDVEHVVLRVLSAVHRHLAALHTDVETRTAVLLGTAFTVDVEHVVLRMLSAVHRHIAAFHAQVRLPTAALLGSMSTDRGTSVHVLLVSVGDCIHGLGRDTLPRRHLRLQEQSEQKRSTSDLSYILHSGT